MVDPYRTINELDLRYVKLVAESSDYVVLAPLVKRDEFHSVELIVRPEGILVIFFPDRPQFISQEPNDIIKAIINLQGMGG